MFRITNRSCTAVLLAVLYIFTSVCCTGITVYAADVSDDLIPNSTDRTPLKDPAPFEPGCITDQLHWIEDSSSTGEGLRPFYSATGVQPYVFFKSYDATLNSSAQKERWAKEYYNSNIKKENGFLFVYFAEKNQDVDVGYMCCVNGSETDSVMDREATDIFMQYLKRYWYTDLSTDDMLTKTFSNTAKSIMMPTSNFFGTLSIIVIIALLLFICFCAVRIVIANNKTKKRQQIRAKKYDRERQNRSTSARTGLLQFDDTDYSKKN